MLGYASAVVRIRAQARATKCSDRSSLAVMRIACVSSRQRTGREAKWPVLGAIEGPEAIMATFRGPLSDASLSLCTL